MPGLLVLELLRISTTCLGSLSTVSQLEALAELNSRGLIPVADLKKHYDKAVMAYPKTYANYSFEQWLNYMQSRMLIARYPSQMVELSFNGKDFLKYLAHVGHDIHGKAN